MPPKRQDGARSRDRKRQKRRRRESYGIYVYNNALKQMHPDTGISSKAFSIMKSFVHDVFEEIAAEASGLQHYNKRYTSTSRENTDVCSSHSTRGTRQARC